MSVESITPQEIAAAIFLPTTTMAEAVTLIESYAKAYASGEVIKAMEAAHLRTMAILEAPLRRSSDAQA